MAAAAAVERSADAVSLHYEEFDKLSHSGKPQSAHVVTNLSTPLKCDSHIMGLFPRWIHEIKTKHLAKVS